MKKLIGMSRGKTLSSLLSLLAVGLIAAAISGQAAAGVTLEHVSFKEWDSPGKRHDGYNQLLDWSSSFWCARGTGRCGSQSRSTGTGNCKRTNANIGFNYNAPLPAAAGSLKFNGGWSQQWEVCSHRSETTSCRGRAGKYTRVEIYQNIRWAQKKVKGWYYATRESIGQRCYPTGRGNTQRCREEFRHVCNDGGNLVRERHGSQHRWVCRHSGNEVKHGWFTNKDFNGCGFYNRLP